MASDIFLNYDSVSNVNGVSCDEASNELYWFNAPTGNATTSTLWRGGMQEDDEPNEQLRNVYLPSDPTYMEEIVYYISNNTELYAFTLDGGDNKLIANGFSNIVDTYSYQGTVFVVDRVLGLYAIRLEDGRYYEEVVINATGI